MKNKSLKLILAIIPIVFILSISTSKADTYSFSYVDPSLETQGNGCTYYSNGNYTSSTGYNCENPVVTVPLTVNFSPNVLSGGGFNGIMVTNYQLCSGQNYNYGCYSPSGTYNGNTDMTLNVSYQTNGFTLKGLTDNNTYYALGDHPRDVDIGYGGDVFWQNLYALSPRPTISQNYEVQVNVGVSLRTGNYFTLHNLGNFVATSYLAIPIATTTNTSPQIFVK